jgi:PAS domain S-box-containing protein
MNAEQHTPDKSTLGPTERYQALARLVHGYVFEARLRADRTTEFTWADGAFAELFGCERAEVNRRGWHSFIDPRDLASAGAALAGVWDGNACEIELRIVGATGTKRWLRMAAEPIRDPQIGSVIGLIGMAEDISNRKAGEAARRDSEARFEAAFEHSVSGIVIEDEYARILRANPAMCRLLGYTQDALLARTLYDVTHPDDLAASKENAEALWARRIRTYTLEKRYIHKSGRIIWVVIAVALIDEGPDGPRHLVSQVHDISELRAAHLALAKSEQKLRGLYETSQLGIALNDIQGHFVEFNEAFERICGYPPEELKALDYWALTPKSYEADEARQLELLKNTGHYGPYEKHYVRKDGSLVPLRLRGMLLRTPDGDSQIWSIVEDISEQKRLEAALRAESARHQLFLRNASDGVHILGDNGCVVEASDSFCAMLGCSREEVIGRHPSQWDSRLAGDDLRKAMESAFAGEQTRFETVHRRKDGTTFDVEVHVEAFEADGRPYLYCAARDITELRRLEHALLNVTNREQQRLGYDLHDELGQVLTGISMLAASLASAASAAGRPVDERLDSLEALARQAIGTCRGIAHGLSPLTYQNGNLEQALSEMVRIQRRSGGAAIDFKVTQSAPLQLGTQAKDHLYRIAQEAVTNARRHANATLIELTLDIQPSTVALEISDDGKGLLPLPTDSGGMGLSIMRFRATMLDAQFSIGPSATAGTRVACRCRNDSSVAPEQTGAVAEHGPDRSGPQTLRS